MGLKGKKDGIVYHIDRVSPEGTQLVIAGFASCKSHETVAISVRKKDGTEFPAETVTITRQCRSDVSELLYGSSEWGPDAGFEIVISRAGNEGAKLAFTAGACREECSVSSKSPVLLLKQKRERKRFRKANKPYRRLAEKFTLYPEHLAAQRNHAFDYTPKISLIVPVYEPDTEYFRQLVESVKNQTYANWEICIACATKGNRTLSQMLRKYKSDLRHFDFKMLEKNEGIAGNTNRAIEISTGDVLVFADQDDILEESAFYYLVKAMNEYPDADLIYTDEDKITMDLDVVYEPHFKTDFNPDLLYTNNYISHLSAVRRSLYNEVGPLNPKMDGAQDYDFILRCTEHARRVVHVPQVLYHWRSHPGSTAAGSSRKEYCLEAGRLSVEEHLRRCRIPARAERDPDCPGYYRVIYKERSEQELARELECLSVAFCGDSAEKIGALQSRMKQLNGENTQLVFYTPKTGLTVPPTGKYILFLNAGCVMEDNSFLSQLLGALERPDVGAVGGCLLNPDRTIYRMGMAFQNGTIFPIFEGFPFSEPAYCNRNRLQQDVSILSFDFLLMRTSLFLEIGGIAKNTDDFMQAADLCLRLRSKGFRLVTMPQVALMLDKEQPKKSFVMNEEDETAKKWREILNGNDPYFPELMTVDERGNWVIS